MSESWEVREGSTATITCQLLAGNTEIDLTDAVRVTLHMKDKQSKTYRYNSEDDPGVIAMSSPLTDGKVTFVPPSGTFINNRTPYLGYWLVYTTETDYYAVPENSEFVFNVRAIF